jgi:hypothetical protein
MHCLVGDAQSIAPRARRRVCSAAAVALALGCAAPKTPPPAPERLPGGAAGDALAAHLRASEDAVPTDSVVFRLAFGAGADLDLYVTDPLTETVYFANTPVRSGGALARDRTCEDAAPRVETVVFERPPPGRYRVGVDHLRSCGDAEPAAFAVEVRAGARHLETTGALPLGRFDPVVLELDLP